MRLSDALGIRQGDIVCFVGAGGKTLACRQLAREQAAMGRRTLATTTTKMMEPVLEPGEIFLLTPALEAALEQVRHAASQHDTVFLAREPAQENIVSLSWLGADYPFKFRPRKLMGVPAAWVQPLSDECGVDVTLVEADGAAHRMLKAPNHAEPVIPDGATLVTPMADMDVLGKPLTEEAVHRPMLLADLAGLPLGSPIGPELVAIALAHPQGGLKGAPEGARVVPLLTTHNPTLTTPSILKAARMLLLSPRIQHVVVAYLRATPVICEVIAR